MAQTKDNSDLIHDVSICAKEKSEASLVYPSNCKAFAVAMGGFISGASVEILLFFQLRVVVGRRRRFLDGPYCCRDSKEQSGAVTHTQTKV